MYNLDEHLKPWVGELHKHLAPIKADSEDHLLRSLKIVFEAATETYLSILQPATTHTVKAILTRTLIECYADSYAIFRHDDPNKQAKKYIKYTLRLNRLFQDQSTQYMQSRDRGVEGELRPFQIANNYMAFWNGKNIINRIQSAGRGSHILAYYEFFSLFTHMSPVRQLYLSYFDADPAIGKYYSHIMLLIMQSLVVGDRLPEHFFESLNKIAANYSADYMKRDFSPKLKNQEN